MGFGDLLLGLLCELFLFGMSEHPERAWSGAHAYGASVVVAIGVASTLWTTVWASGIVGVVPEVFFVFEFFVC